MNGSPNGAMPPYGQRGSWHRLHGTAAYRRSPRCIDSISIVLMILRSEFVAMHVCAATCRSFGFVELCTPRRCSHHATWGRQRFWSVGGLNGAAPEIDLVRRRRQRHCYPAARAVAESQFCNITV